MKALLSSAALVFAFLPGLVVGQNPPPVTIDTLSSDQDGHHKGDIRITLPQNAASSLTAAIAKLGGHDTCQTPHSFNRRDPTQVRLQEARNAAITQLLMQFAIPGALLNGFNLQNQIGVPRFRDTVVQAQIVAVQAWAACQAAFTNVAHELLNDIVEITYIAVRDYCIISEINAQVQTVIWILNQDIDTNQNDDNDNHCPAKKSESPACQDCGGNSNNRCTTGQYTDCTCLDYAVVHTHPGNRRDLEKAQAVMAGMLNQDYPTVKKADGGDVQCGTAYDQGNANYFATLGTMNKAAAFFCKQMGDQNIKFEAKKTAEMHELHYNNHHWDPIYVAVEWNPDDPGSQPLDFSNKDAQNTCVDRLSTIINACDTAKNGNINWKQGGTFYRGGMKWYINRDTWAVGLVNSDPAWQPRVVTCDQDSDCNRTPWPCQGTCQKDDKYSDVGFCPCGSGL